MIPPPYTCPAVWPSLCVLSPEPQPHWCPWVDKAASPLPVRFIPLPGLSYPPRPREEEDFQGARNFWHQLWSSALVESRRQRSFSPEVGGVVAGEGVDLQGILGSEILDVRELDCGGSILEETKKCKERRGEEERGERETKKEKRTGPSGLAAKVLE